MYTVGVERADFKPLVVDILRSGQQLRFRASGKSMLPFIRSGDVLHIDSDSPVRYGDVILFCAGDERLVVHRVVRVVRERGEAGVVVRGDALSVPDGFFPVREILGRVVALDRRGRTICVDAGLQRWLGLLWLSTWPLSHRLYFGLVRLKERTHSKLRASLKSTLTS